MSEQTKSAPVSAPGPWERLQDAAYANAHGQLPARELVEIAKGCPNPREADLAGEALDALAALLNLVAEAEELDWILTNPDRSEGETVARARSILRRAGRLS